LQAGQRVDIRLDYLQYSGGADTYMFWSSPSQPKQIIPQNSLYPAVTSVPPEVGIASPFSGAVLSARSGIPITAVASSPSGSVAQVAFYANGACIGTSTASPYSVNWRPRLAIGTYTLTAVATDNVGATTISDPVTIVLHP
jgi:hypothetical protein